MATVTGIGRGIDGWALTRALQLEPTKPGLIVELLQANSLRRQTAFALLAHIDGADDLQHIAELLAVFRVGGRDHRSAHLRIADAITSRRPGDVISALAGGRPPEPLVGCLARIGHKALNDPTLYADLISICRDDPRRAGIFAMGGGRITEEAIRTLLVADPIMLDPAIIAKIDTAADAKALSACVNVIRGLAAELPTR